MCSRCSPQSLLQAAPHFPDSGPQPVGGGEGRPAGAAQPRGGRTELLHPERPLSPAGVNMNSTIRSTCCWFYCRKPWFVVLQEREEELHKQLKANTGDEFDLSSLALDEPPSPKEDVRTISSHTPSAAVSPGCCAAAVIFRLDLTHICVCV